MAPSGSRRVLAVVFAGVIAGSLVAPRAGATVMVRESVEDLADGSDVVAVCTVVSRTSRWDHGHIVTDVSVQVERSLRGTHAAGDALTVATPGGTIGDTGQRVAGAPWLLPGERSVLFLRAQSGGGYVVAGWSQGVLAVRAVRDATGAVQDKVYPPDTTGLTAVSTPPARSTGVAPTPSRGTWQVPVGGVTVEELATHVR